jgi:hypothetical protein
MKDDALPPEADASLDAFLRIPPWVPKTVALAARQAYAVVNGKPRMIEYLVRLVSDERMRGVWHELGRRHRDGTFMHPAASAPAYAPISATAYVTLGYVTPASSVSVTADEWQDEAMASLLRAALDYAVNRGATFRARGLSRIVFTISRWRDSCEPTPRGCGSTLKGCETAIAAAYSCPQPRPTPEPLRASPTNWKAGCGSGTAPSFASETAASPRINGSRSISQPNAGGGLVRRTTVSPRSSCRSSSTAKSRRALSDSGALSTLRVRPKKSALNRRLPKHFGLPHISGEQLDRAGYGGKSCRLNLMNG